MASREPPSTSTPIPPAASLNRSGPEFVATVVQDGRQVECVGGFQSVACPQLTCSIEDAAVAAKPALRRKEVLVIRNQLGIRLSQRLDDRLQTHKGRDAQERVAASRQEFACPLAEPPGILDQVDHDTGIEIGTAYQWSPQSSRSAAIRRCTSFGSLTGRWAKRGDATGPRRRPLSPRRQGTPCGGRTDRQQGQIGRLQRADPSVSVDHDFDRCQHDLAS